MGVSEPFAVTRDGDGRPLGEAFAANVVRPDEVPGAELLAASAMLLSLGGARLNTRVPPFTLSQF